MADVSPSRYFWIFIWLVLLQIVSCKKDTTIEKTYHEDGDVVPLFLNHPHGVNLVILGDGFTKSDLEKGGFYDYTVKSRVDYLFTIPPYKQYRDYFNVYVVYAESNEKGAFVGYYPTSKRTRFNTYYDALVTRLLQVGDEAACYSYVEKALPLDEVHIILMIVNDNRYGGSGGPITVIANDTYAEHTMIHELGHSFGGLGDEYVDETDSVGWDLRFIDTLPNLDTTADRSKVKWAHFLNNPQYNSTVGIFEGGFNHPKGVFRPSENSVMNGINSPYYNAPCREAIVKRIDEILGIPFDQNDFYRNDVLNSPGMIGLPGILQPTSDFHP